MDNNTNTQNIITHPTLVAYDTHKAALDRIEYLERDLQYARNNLFNLRTEVTSAIGNMVANDIDIEDFCDVLFYQFDIDDPRKEEFTASVTITIELEGTYTKDATEHDIQSAIEEALSLRFKGHDDGSIVVQQDDCFDVEVDVRL